LNNATAKAMMKKENQMMLRAIDADYKTCLQQESL
jgi:hypothetical protein